MNKITDSWDSWQQPEDDIPDAVKIDGVKFQVESKEEMAQRKAPDLGPHIDESSKAAKADDMLKKIIRELPEQDFDNVIRHVLKSPIDHAHEVRQATFDVLGKLKVKRDTSKARTQVPDGSDQMALGSIVTWLQNIKPEDKKSIEQLIVLDATCCVRMKKGKK